MSKTFIKSLVAGLGLVMVSQAANADVFSVSAVGALDMSKVNYDPAVAGVTSGYGTSYGFGALARMMVFPMFQGEVGAIYLNRKNSSTVTILGTPFSMDTSQKEIQIPVLLRFTALPMFSIGAGGFYSVAMGDPSVSISDPTLQAAVNATASSAVKGNYGLAGSIAFNMPILPTVSVLVDGRYLYGLKNLAASTSTDKETTTDLQVLAGVTFGI